LQFLWLTGLGRSILPIVDPIDGGVADGLQAMPFS
jgi:hypothetical protein